MIIRGQHFRYNTNFLTDHGGCGGQSVQLGRCAEAQGEGRRRGQGKHQIRRLRRFYESQTLDKEICSDEGGHFCVIVDAFVLAGEMKSHSYGPLRSAITAHNFTVAVHESRWPAHIWSDRARRLEEGGNYERAHQLYAIVTSHLQGQTVCTMVVQFSCTE